MKECGGFFAVIVYMNLQLCNVDEIERKCDIN